MSELYNEIEKLIENIVGKTGELYELGAFSGIGWSHASTPMNRESSNHIVVIKKQKNAVHVYYAFWKFDEDEKNRIVSVFGKSAVGKNCIRIKKMTEERREVLAFNINKSKGT
jgi:hypothetical protein